MKDKEQWKYAVEKGLCIVIVIFMYFYVWIDFVGQRAVKKGMHNFAVICVVYKGIECN